jgi:hypothetical protein
MVGCSAVEIRVGYDESMTIDKALKAARRLATLYDAELGKCLFAEPMGDDWCAFSFDIKNGPKDWSWTTILDGTGPGSVIFATHRRPHPLCAPKLRRRWWLFGPIDYRLHWQAYLERVKKAGQQ